MNRFIRTSAFLAVIGLICSCGGSGSSTPASLSFSATQVTITPAISRLVTLTLTGGGTATVTLASSSTAAATVSPATCSLSASTTSCSVTITGVATGSASISATATGYQVTPVAVTVAGSTTQFSVVNDCSYTVWMQSENAPSAADAIVMIPSHQVYDYDINNPTLVSAFRVWPKTGCDSSGQNCNTGQQLTPCPNSICQPPIDSLWEGTFNYSDADPTQPGNNTSYDTSLVAGFTIPFTATVIPGSDETSTTCLNVDASAISLDDCPTTEDLSTPAAQMTGFGSYAFGPFTTYPDGNGVTRTLTSVSLSSTYPTTGQVEGCMSPQTVMNFTDANGFGGLNLGANSHDPAYSAPFISPVLMYACPFTTSQLIAGNILPNLIDPDPVASEGFTKMSAFCNATAGYCDTGGSMGPAANKVCNLGPINNTQYVQYLHAHTTNLYAQTYDDRTGNLECNSSATKFVFTLCP